MTTGYLKDVSHMKQMMYFKKNEELQIFEVSYLNASEVLDED